MSNNTFNPDINIGKGIFGLPHKFEDSKIILLPVPWDATTTYHDGAANAPEAIYKASFQLDLYQDYSPEFFKTGIYFSNIPQEIIRLNKRTKIKSKQLIEQFSKEKNDTRAYARLAKTINTASETVMNYVYEQSSKILNQKKFAAVIGGEHSVSYGLIKALSEKYNEFGVLQIDAHADLRKAYQGLTYSHASIMHNVLEISQVTKLVQVGIRDYCFEEAERINKEEKRISCFTDRYIYQQMFLGKCWDTVVKQIVEHLPQKVHISVDIDGLDPSLCPNTGTPVAGGLTFQMLWYLLEHLVESERQIIGFDLCEVAPSKKVENDWDANVGARVLYQLCMYTSECI